MPVYVIKVVSNGVGHRPPTYFVEAISSETALAAVQAERGADGGALEVTEEFGRTDAFAVRSTGTWIQRVSDT